MKVYIIDNSMITWAWICEIASHHKDMEIIGFSDKAEDAIRTFNKFEPDFVIFNPKLFPGNTIRIINEMKHHKPGATFAEISNNTQFEFNEACRTLGVDYHFIQTKDYYQKIQEILLNNALANRIHREWYNLSLNN